MLSPVIVSRIYRYYKKNDLHAGITIEVNHVKGRLILTLDKISRRTGTYDRELAEWLLEHYQKVEMKDSIIMNFYHKQLQMNDTEFEAMLIHQPQTANSAFSVKEK